MKRSEVVVGQRFRIRKPHEGDELAAGTVVEVRGKTGFQRRPRKNVTATAPEWLDAVIQVVRVADIAHEVPKTYVVAAADLEDLEPG